MTDLTEHAPPVAAPDLQFQPWQGHLTPRWAVEGETQVIGLDRPDRDLTTADDSRVRLLDHSDMSDGAETGSDLREFRIARTMRWDEPTIRKIEIVTTRWLDAQPSERTQAAYRTDARQFFDWCGRRDVNPVQASPSDVRPFAAHLRRRGVARSTEHRKLTTVSSWYRFALEDDLELVDTNPMERVRRPRRDSKPDNVGVTDREIRALLAAADLSGRQDAALVRLLCFTGARVSELCTATTWQLRTELGTRVLKVTRKGGAQDKVVLPAPAADALDAHLAGRDGPLFEDRNGMPRDRHWAQYRLNVLCARAGLRTIRPHAFRHALTTRLLLDGHPLQDVRDTLGHASSDTTLRYHRGALAVDRSPTHALAAALEPDGHADDRSTA